MSKLVIAESDYGYEIYVDLIASSAGHYLNQHPYVINLIKKILATQKLTGKQVVIEQDMDRDIGTTDIVSTDINDTIYYARPVKSEVFSRFAKNRYPQSCKTLSIIVKQDAEGNYAISDTYIGHYYPGFPGSQNETVNSKQYWRTHALVHNARIIQSKSITKNWPY